MSTPRFSVLVPTRDRPATLRHTLATVAAQSGDDYEIVVADNCGGPETRAIVEALAAPAVRYTRADEVLPMAENWERGLALCGGEYVTVLGDDDGLVPDTLARARRLIEVTKTALLSWAPHTYWWPDTIVHWARNLLIVSLADGASEYGSHDVLQAFYRGAVGFDFTPMIYKGFYRRDLIEEARARYGGFFVPREAAPDISSGILGLYLTERYVHSRRPLSIRGNSGKSNGTAQWARSLGAEQRAIYFREERIGLQGMIHPALVPSPNLHIIVANAKLRCKELYFPEDAGLELDLVGVLKQMVESLNYEPEAYEENLADARALAERLDVELAPQDLPPMEPVERRRSHGPSTSAEGDTTLRIDGDLAGVHDVAAASRLVGALLPPPD